jgi:hypothetical protein
VQITYLRQRAIDLTRFSQLVQLSTLKVSAVAIQAALAAVVRDIDHIRCCFSGGAKNRIVLEGEPRQRVLAAKAQVGLVAVGDAIVKSHLSPVAVVVEASRGISGGKAVLEYCMVPQLLIVTASRFEAVAIATAGSAIFQVAVLNGPTVLVGGGYLVNASQIAVPAIIQILPGPRPDSQ